MKEYISLEEAAVLLARTTDEVNDMISQGELTAYRIGGQFLRLKRDEVEAHKGSPGVAIDTKSAAKQKKERLAAGSKTHRGLGDFLYFNDFYIMSLMICAGLVYLILRMQF